MQQALSILNDSNSNIVRIGGISILTSYDATVAFNDGIQSWVNPRYKGFSATTTKHLSAGGYRDAPVADSERHFHLYLADAIASEADRVRVGLLNGD